MGRTEKSEEGVAGEDFGLNCDEKEGALWAEDQRKQEKIEKKSRVRPTAQGPREKHSSHQSRDMCFALDPAPNQ